MRTSGINHVSIHATDLDQSVRFYVELLDAEVLDTPNFGVPVQWLALGDTQLHIFIRPATAQSHHHFAITVEDLEPVYNRAKAMGALDGRSHGHHLIELPGDVAQTYVRDPAGNLMEIDTPGASRLPEALRREMVPLSEMFPQNEENRRARLFVREGATSL
ncbi:MAG TPA: VOC family protein [Solirubrobacter sp.]|nr:VOC family protein [Solirubrobacter sp.]